MPKGIWVVSTHPTDPSVEAEYNEWYDTVHLPELCELPGIVSARRFKVNERQRGGGPPTTIHDYLAIYELDSADLLETVEEVARRSLRGDIRMTATLRQDPPSSTILYRTI